MKIFETKFRAEKVTKKINQKKKKKKMSDETR
jgi:hypothetical protein